SWGSSTLAARSAFCGSSSRTQRSLEAVKEATIRLPISSTLASAPPISSMSASACGADRVSFHSSASRTTSPRVSSSTMPCCWPPTATASARSSRGPAASSAAASQARGSTSVPSGCAARRSSRTSPGAASTRSDLVAWVEASMASTGVVIWDPSRVVEAEEAVRGATEDEADGQLRTRLCSACTCHTYAGHVHAEHRSVRPAGAASAGRASGAEAEQVLHGQLLQAHEAVVALPGLVGVEVLVGGAVREQVRDGLALAEGGLGGLLDAGVRQRLLHLGVLAEREGALLEHQVHLHVRGGGVVLALLVLGARGLEVEVAGALVGAGLGREAVLEQVD